LKTSAWVTIGGGGMAPASTLADRVAAGFGAPYLEGYGCGEVGVIAGTAIGTRAKGGVFDRVLVPEIATVDADGAPTVAGVPGEIVVRGPQVFAGYAGDPEGSKAAFFPGGWFRTGDVGVLDDGGRLRLTGRLKEMINRGGEKVAPAEVEAALLAHPAAAEAAVFALAKDGIGEEIAAVVVLHPGAVADEHELRRAVARRLAPGKVPRRVWVRDSLPRTASGKVQRRELARFYTVSGDRAAGERGS
jgi:acyl-CoA synthetase (AMP-forming)/AMP-acid ligase II